MDKKYAVVIGAGSGLGLAGAQSLTKNGFTVFAIDLNISGILNEQGIIAIQADVTDKLSMQAAKEQIARYTNQIALLSYFPGIVVLGSVIETDESLLKRIFEINFFGMYCAVKLFFDMLKNGGGRVVNISSEYGVLDSLPFHSFYTSSKHAVEVYMDGLRRELMFQGLKVVTIRPGAFKTSMQGGVTKQFEKLVAATVYYEDTLLKMQSLMLGELKRAKSAQKFTKVYLKAATAKRPKIYYRVGNSLKMKVLNVLPPKLQDVALKIFFKLKKVKRDKTK